MNHNIPTAADVKATLNSRTETANDVLMEFGSKMADSRYVTGMRYGTQENPYWQVISKGTLSSDDKEYIKKTLEEAGWKVDDIINSGENGEKPGICSIRVSFP